MPAHAGRRAALVAAAVVPVLLIAGCAGNPNESTGASAPGTSTATTTEPTTTTVPPLTADEDAWLKAMSKLGKRYDNIVADSPTNWTAAVMARLASQMRGCSRELARLGSPSDRLQPVHKLVKQACAQNEKGAKCLAAAAGIIGHPIASGAEERKLDQSINCGITAGVKSTEYLGLAETEVLEIRQTTG